MCAVVVSQKQFAMAWGYIIQQKNMYLKNLNKIPTETDIIVLVEISHTLERIKMRKSEGGRERRFKLRQTGKTREHSTSRMACTRRERRSCMVEWECEKLEHTLSITLGRDESSSTAATRTSKSLNRKLKSRFPSVQRSDAWEDWATPLLLWDTVRLCKYTQNSASASKTRNPLRRQLIRQTYSFAELIHCKSARNDLSSYENLKHLFLFLKYSKQFSYIIPAAKDDEH